MHLFDCRCETNTPEGDIVNPLTHKFARPFVCVDTDDEATTDISPELSRLIAQEERVIVPHCGSIEIINLATAECPKEVKVGSLMDTKDRKDLIALLHKFCDVFAWSYEDMPGLERRIVEQNCP